MGYLHITHYIIYIRTGHMFLSRKIIFFNYLIYSIIIFTDIVKGLSVIFREPVPLGATDCVSIFIQRELIFRLCSSINGVQPNTCQVSNKNKPLWNIFYNGMLFYSYSRVLKLREPQISQLKERMDYCSIYIFLKTYSAHPKKPNSAQEISKCLCFTDLCLNFLHLPALIK